MVTSDVMALSASESVEFRGREEGRLTSERRRCDEAGGEKRGFSESLAALMTTECDLRERFDSGAGHGIGIPSISYNSS